MPSGGRCSICSGPHRAAIDKALIDGVSLRKIAQTDGIGHQSVMRHRDAHLSRGLRQAAARSAAARDLKLAGSLADQVEQLKGKASELLGSAEESGDLRTAIQALREISRLLELLGRFTGAPGGDGVSINLGGGPMSNVVVVLPSNGRESTDDSTPKITFEEIQEVRRLRHDRRV